MVEVWIVSTKGENAISLTVGLGGSGLVERILKDSSDSKDQ